MKIEDVRLGMPLVTTGGIPSTVVAISKEGDLWLETADRTRFPVHAECVQPVVDLSIALGKARRELDEISDTIAKCYKQVEPEKLLMSQEARRVVEFLEVARYPMYLGGIRTGMESIMSGMAIMDGLIEARDAGVVQLVDGKYQTARD